MTPLGHYRWSRRVREESAIAAIADVIAHSLATKRPRQSRGRVVADAADTAPRRRLQDRASESRIAQFPSRRNDLLAGRRSAELALTAAPSSVTAASRGLERQRGASPYRRPRHQRAGPISAALINPSPLAPGLIRIGIYPPIAAGSSGHIPAFSVGRPIPGPWLQYATSGRAGRDQCGYDNEGGSSQADDYTLS
jgi:hypothetical protein